MNEKKSAVMPLARRRCKKDNFNKTILNVPFVKEYKYLGIIFDFSLKFDLSLIKASNSVRIMNNYKILTQNNLSINQKLSIWKTYFYSKILYPLIIMCLMKKSAAQKVSSQISASIKKCLGLHPSLSKEKLYTWLYEITPLESAEFFLLRTMKKLLKTNHYVKNKVYFENCVTSFEKEDIVKFLNDEIKISSIKEKIIDKRAKQAGILNGKPFETISSKDLDWIRFTTRELDLFRWKGVTCKMCKCYLSTEHIKICVGTKSEREIIKLKTGFEASMILEDPSLLNKGPKQEVKKLKTFVASRISKMIHSAGRSVIM